MIGLLSLSLFDTVFLIAVPLPLSPLLPVCCLLKNPPLSTPLEVESFGIPHYMPLPFCDFFSFFLSLFIR